MTAPEQQRPGATLDDLCRVAHDVYERTAVEQGWQTQQASRVSWDEVPAANKATMQAAIGAVAAAVRADERAKVLNEIGWHFDPDFGWHPFENGIDVDMLAEGRLPDPRWCNACGSSR